MPATIITITNEIEIARATKYSSPEIVINKNKITDKITPLRIDKKVSLIYLLFTLPLMSSLASPCTIIALDWTPTFPAIAAIKGVK